MCSLHISIRNKSQGGAAVTLHKDRAHLCCIDDICEEPRRSGLSELSEEEKHCESPSNSFN